jgi:deoxyribonuclease-4
MTHTSEEPIIGAHVSISGGVHHAIEAAIEIGATTIQIFTANQKRWQTPLINEKELGLWNEMIKSSPLKKVMSHDSYLINLGSIDEALIEKSLQAFTNEIDRCHQLNLSFLNFHPGAYTTGSEEECLNTIIKSLKKLKKVIDKGQTRLLIETTAGQGTCVGHRFEQIGYLISNLDEHIPIGVCIDTCHIFAAGYDIRTEKGWDETLKEFNHHIGLKHLYAFHVNDSLKPLGSRKDRHANLGEGEIGMPCFKTLMTHPKLSHLPKYLETPGGMDCWKNEIALLKKYHKKVE